jgi:phosphosulfolactate phosphohydrolase-like enzyme
MPVIPAPLITRLTGLGLTEDIRHCAQPDIYDVVPIFHRDNGSVTL